ncbi:LAS seventeen-binding protein [Phlyctema vagabunda]|uniref:LAS seventeen-binding protein n=1 Tax=Phlyctema vagabunda TaxID=108571 RepID=A0ABR4PB00_9HELO
MATMATTTVNEPTIALFNESTVHRTRSLTWQKTTRTGKVGFDQLWAGFERLGGPVSRFTNRIGSEAFWPADLNRESEKCARILKSFCKDGFYSERTNSLHLKEGPKMKPKVLLKIPQKVIKNAVALAIFTTVRAGFWISGAGGSGVLIARLPDGNWSPPSGILINTAGFGLIAGIDIYDCVLVINTLEALAAFKKVRLSLGGEISVAAGPFGVGGIGEVDFSLEKPKKPIWAYTKSRGVYAGAQIDGSLIIERSDENARFYGQRLCAAKILSGSLENTPDSTRLLIEVVTEAEGRKDLNLGLAGQVRELPSPGDVGVEKSQEASPERKGEYDESINKSHVSTPKMSEDYQEIIKEYDEVGGKGKAVPSQESKAHDQQESEEPDSKDKSGSLHENIEDRGSASEQEHSSPPGVVVTESRSKDEATSSEEVRPYKQAVRYA